MEATPLDEGSFQKLVQGYTPVNDYNSPFSLTNILLEKGDSSDIASTSTPKNQESIQPLTLEQQTAIWFERGQQRTIDFVPRFRFRRIRQEADVDSKKPLNPDKIIGAREIVRIKEVYFKRVKDRRNFRERTSPRAKGTRAHIRNYKPEIPYRPRIGYFNYRDNLERTSINSVIQALTEDYESGLMDIPRYSRPFFNEESQTMPKIPYHEIRALRKQSIMVRRARYMEVDFSGTRHGGYLSTNYYEDWQAPPQKLNKHHSGIPAKKSGDSKHGIVWTYHAPKGRIGNVNPLYKP